jgi:3-methylcrotonyl-CoA carboxylase alpha subunit
VSGAFSIEELGNGRFRMSDGTTSWRIVADRVGSEIVLTIEGIGTMRIDRAQGVRRRSREHAVGLLTAPMPGKIVKVSVKAGESVARGQDLVVLEAMKMEIKVTAPSDGRVRAVNVASGDPCDAGQVLVELES